MFYNWYCIFILLGILFLFCHRSTSILSARLSPSAVHDPIFSFNAFLFCPNTAPPFCHLVTKICWSLHSHSCPTSLEPTTNSPKPHLVLSLHSFFHSKLKTLLFNKSYPDLSSSLSVPSSVPTSIPPSPSQLLTPSTIAVYLSACLSLLIWPDAYIFCF